VKVIQPRPFTFREGSRAVLLLHGFTGHSADVRMLGRYLQKKGYTSHGPIYHGHGLSPEELIESSPDLWWKDVLEAYHYLQYLGYHEIAVAGLSIGGALGLRLAHLEDVKAIIPMCTPMFFDNKTQLTAGFKVFATEYKQLEQKDEKTIKNEVGHLIEKSYDIFQQVGKFITNTSEEIHKIDIPSFVVQAHDDHIINPESATYIYENIGSDNKDIKWYEDAGHAITLGKKRDQLHIDIYEFLESLDWVD